MAGRRLHLFPYADVMLFSISWYVRSIWSVVSVAYAAFGTLEVISQASGRGVEVGVDQTH